MQSNFLATLRHTLKTNKGLIIGVFLSIGLINVAFFSFLATQNRSEIEANLLSDVETAAVYVNSIIYQMEATLATVSQAPSVRQKNTELANQYMQRVKAQFPDIEAINIADLNGHVLATSDLSPLKVNVAERSYFKGALNNNGLFVSDGLISVLNNKPIFAISLPVFNNSGKPIAVAYTILPLEALNKKLNSMTIGENQHIHLIDSKGVALICQEELVQSQGVQEHLLKLKKQFSGAKGTQSLFDPVKNKKELYAFMPLAKTEWLLAVDIPLNAVYAALFSKIMQAFLLFLVLVAPTLFIFWLFFLKLADQQKQLKNSNEFLSRLAITDGLTGLYNHRYFQETLETWVAEAKEKSQPLSLIMLDIDYFKHFNDTYGHMAGDTVLKELAQILTTLVAKNGFVARYGGEEFAIIIKDLHAREALELAEKLRSVVEKHDFNGIEGLEAGEVTLSIGLASFPEHATQKEDLVRLTDQALYKAKFSAKNKVEVYYSVLDDLKTHLNQSELNLLSSIKTLITVINAKDRYTYGHSERVMELSVAIGQKLGLNQESLDIIKYGAFIHDIGKIEIAHEILNKPGPLTSEEFAIIKEHPLIGVKIIQPIDALKKAIPIILHHHERYDGKGYPQGLEREELPLVARIVAVADSFDAMTTDRPYKNAKSIGEALEELKRCAGTQFDPEIVEIFNEIISTESRAS